MAMTTIEGARPVTGGVDTHGEVHVAAALDARGGVLGTAAFRADPEGYRELLGWLESFGRPEVVGVEATGAYGAGLSRFFQRHGIGVIEVDRPNRQARRRQGKSDPLDAIEAARSALARRGGAPKSKDGAAEALRVLLVAYRSATQSRTKALVQMRHLAYCAPDEVASSVKGLRISALVDTAVGLDAEPAQDLVTRATCLALASVGRRVQVLDEERRALLGALRPLVASSAPQLLGQARGRRHHGGHLGGGGRGQPRASAHRGRLGASVRGGAPRGLLGQGHPSPPRPRWQPTGQWCPVAHRDGSADL